MWEAKKRKTIVGSSTPEKEEASRLENAGKVGEAGWGDISGSPKQVKGSAFRGREHSKWSKE